MPNPKAVERALALIRKGRTQRVYFFDKLDDPAWIEPLQARGLFADPPAPLEQEDGTAYPAWAESGYLVRMAEKAPDAVAAVLKSIPESENERVRTDLVDAAARLPLEAAKEQAERERRWLREHDHVWLLYPDAIGRLVIHLAELGDADEALALLRELLAVSPPPEGDRWRLHVETKVDRWHYEKVLKDTLPKFVKLLGISGVELAADLLDAAVGTSTYSDSPSDGSSIWRPSIGDHEQNVGMDTRDALITMIRDTVLHWIGNDAGRLGEVLDSLGARTWTVFKRIALFVLARKAELDRDRAVSAALDPTNFYDEHAIHEYMDLVRRALPLMDEDEQTKWFSMVDAGPEWPPRDPEVRKKEGISDDDFHRLKAIWRRDRLAALDDALPDAYADELKKLSDEYGPADHPTMRSYSTSWVGPTSPLSEAEINEMEPAALLEYARTWTPSSDPMTPSPEGLGRLMTARVGESPEPFAELADAFAKLDPTYVSAALRGFEEASKAGAEFDWEGVLAVAELAVQARELDAGLSPEEREGQDWDRDWRWSRQCAASVLEAGMTRQLPPIVLADRIWKVLDVLSWDEEPSLEYEEQYGGSNMDPLTLSINTVRGEAMHAVVQFATWWRLEHEGQEFVLADLPHVRENLEAHLDPSKESSETVRAVFGSRFPQLHWLDRTWAKDQVRRVFPDNDQRLRLAAWETYLVWGKPNTAVYEVLENEYRRAVDELPTPEERRQGAGRDPGLSLSDHLVALYCWGSLDLSEDGLLYRFVANASAAEAAHLVDTAGRALDDGRLDATVALRLQDLWEHVRTWVADRPREERNSILAPFGWWYGSGALDPSWSDRELISLLEDGVPVDAGFSIGERLRERSGEDIRSAVTVTEAIVPSLAGGWELLGMRDELRAVLAQGLRAEDKEVVEASTRVIHALGAQRLLDFRNLLS